MVEGLECRLLLSRNWFVATTGVDSNQGTLAAPLGTIQQAANLARPGDTVLIRGGTYHETVTPPRSGIPGAPITFAAYHNEPVVISGADPIGPWSTYQNAIYQAAGSWDLGDGYNQVFVDGQMLNEARWPNASLDLSHPTFATVNSLVTSSAGTGWLVPSTATVLDPTIPGPAGAWNGATIHIASGQGWVFASGTVLSSAPGQITYAFEHFTSYEIPVAGNRYYISGKFQALDAPGEWYRDPSTSRLYVWTPLGDSPAVHDVQAKHRLYAFELSSRSYINIQGVQLFAASIDTDSASNHLVLDGVSARYVSQVALNPIPWDGNARGATTGILLNGSHNTLQNSMIAWSSGDGVTVSGSDNTVRNCTIHDVDYAAGDEAAIRVIGTNQTLVGNTIYNAGRDGIQDTYAVRSHFVYNIIHDVGLQTTDLGGVYGWGTNGLGTVIAYNRIFNIHTSGFGAGGVYLDNGCFGYVIHDNWIWNVDSPIKLNPPAYNNRIYNNHGAAIVGGQQDPPAAPGVVTASSGATVSDLGSLGGFTSEAYGINNAGQAVGASTSGLGAPAFLYSGAAAISLGTFGGAYSIATGINGAGQIAGAAFAATGPRHAFRYASGQMSDLGVLPGDLGSYAVGIDSAGDVVGTSYGADGIGRAFVWSGGKMQPVGTLGGSVSAAFGINDFGLIVGASTLPDNRNAHAFVRWNGAVYDIGTLGGSSSYALALNNHGQIVGESLIKGDTAVHAFLYLNGTMTDLGALPGLPNTVATGINNSGDVVGFAYSSNYLTQHAFLYHNGVIYDLNALVAGSGWTFKSADAINDSEQIVGGGKDPSGYHRAFLLRL